MHIDLLSDLNTEQRDAVTHGDGPLLIVAGAGTGKTMVITRRIAWLILSGKCGTDEVLALTFTDKAAGEMEERVDRLLPYGYVHLWVSTFHSFCERILRGHALDVGLSSDFKLLDTTGAWLLIRKNLDRFKLDYYRPLGNPAKFIHALLRHFSRAKDEEVSPDAYCEYVQGLRLNADAVAHGTERDSEILRVFEIADAYHTYEKLLLENNALDFGGLISATLRLFRTRPGVLEKYRTQFRFILVDEFQDTNYAQYELIKFLSSPRNNLTVVGDDDQSIYAFRGTSIENILDFKKGFPKSREVCLLDNYRSAQNILDCAHAFIQQNNPHRLEYQLASQNLSKKLRATGSQQGKIEYLPCATLDDETRSVVQKIGELKKSDPLLPWGEIAVLVRSNDAADPFIHALEDERIPYQFVALKGLYVKPAIIDLLSFCKLLDDYHESTALYRVLSFPFFSLDHAGIVHLSHYAHQKGISLWGALEKVDFISDISAHNRAELKKIHALIERVAPRVRQIRCSEAFAVIVRESGYLSFVRDCETREKKEALEHINQLYDKVKQLQIELPHARIRDMLTLVAYEREAGDEGALKDIGDFDPESVKVMTVHSAKGLEFTHVFIVNLSDRRFPTVERGEQIELPEPLIRTKAFSLTDAHLHEERRLFYVALTRAKERVFLSAANTYGNARRRRPSRFLSEIGFEETAPSLAGRESLRVISNYSLSGMAQKAHVAQSALPIPTVFSFTQLSAFETCPLQYKFAFLLKIPVFGKPSLSFGKSMHQTLQKICERMIALRSSMQGDLFKQTQKDYTDERPPIPSWEDFSTFYRASWIPDWYPSKKIHDEYFEKGTEMLKCFYDDCAANPPLPMWIEREFVLKVGVAQSSITLKGRIDRIDHLASGGLGIIDYKTGRPKISPTLQSADKRQLLLYQVAAEEVFGERVERLTYHYLDGGVRTSFLGSDAEKNAMKEKILTTVDALRKSSFEATPGWHCQFCDFADICEFRK